MQSIILWLEDHLLTCPYKAVSGFDCPGCGIQRSFIELLKGNFYISWCLYPALFPTIFTLLFTGLHLYFNFKNYEATFKNCFLFFYFFFRCSG
ncbi:MAG: DUF2752 domain-containing protein [Bacteroidetes bacterium]|nr:DUF2752 domain-containing protein [Bacteroidota bacterium]